MEKTFSRKTSSVSTFSFFEPVTFKCDIVDSKAEFNRLAGKCDDDDEDFGAMLGTEDSPRSGAEEEYKRGASTKKVGKS